MLVRSRIIKNIRYFHKTSLVKASILPDNAPTQAENEQWLQKLSEEDPSSFDNDFDIDNDPISASDFPLNFILSKRNGSKLDLSGEERSLKDLKFKIVDEDKFGFHNLSMTLKDYFMGSEYSQSIFSRFGNNRISQARKIEQKTFVDLKIVNIASGRGGNGCVSFLRDANRPIGPPDGGDGGDGGDIYIRVVEGITSLHKVRKSYRSGNGILGSGNQLDGKTGVDVIIDVPVGTTIRWIPEPTDIKQILKQTKGDLSNAEFQIKGVGNYKDDPEISNVQLFRQNLYGVGEGWLFKEKDSDYHVERSYFNDLNETVGIYDKEIIGEELSNDKFPLLGIDFNEPTTKPKLFMKGGKGGMGNMHFLTKDIRNPRFAKLGREGLQGSFLFELKLIADLGLVGLPNAGKSTLLTSISRARPRIGHWEFTTLQPTIGTIFTRIDEDPFTVADIPGIIKGALENKGMGLDFLRHIERTSGLVFVVSIERERSDPVGDLKTLINELTEKKIANKKVLVVATKADLSDNGEKFNELSEFVSKQQQGDWKVVPVCAMKGRTLKNVFN